jgi:beta-phosphoglucomutase-like phosphatase (HAD superfamily)
MGDGLCHAARVSWSLLAVPLHRYAGAGALDWAASARFSRGVPDRAPDAQPLPTVTEVLAVFRESSCFGVSWFRLADPSCEVGLAGSGEFDLGEVTIQVVGRSSLDEPVCVDDEVEALGFRKPRPDAVLRAVRALTVTAGPLLVFDDTGFDVFVVWPDDDGADLVAEWPW